MVGPTFRVTVIARTHGQGTGRGSVVFNLCTFDEDATDVLVCSGGNIVMKAAHFKAFLKALRATDVSTNVEMHDRFVGRDPCGKEGT